MLLFVNGLGRDELDGCIGFVEVDDEGSFVEDQGLKMSSSSLSD